MVIYYTLTSTLEEEQENLVIRKQLNIVKSKDVSKLIILY